MTSHSRSTNNDSSLRQRIYDAPGLRSIFNFFIGFVQKENFKTTVVLFYATFALTLWKYASTAPQFADPETGRILLEHSVKRAPEAVSCLDFLWNARKIWLAFFLMGAIPALIIKCLFKERLADYGATLGNKTRTIRTCLILAPLCALVGWLSGLSPTFYAVYPYNPLAGSSWGALCAHLILYGFLYYTAWEFMFRGFIQRGLESQLGVVPSIAIQTLATTMLHYGNPASETISCIFVGVLWGYLAIRTRSLVSGWLQHAAVGILLDFSLVVHAL